MPFHNTKIRKQMSFKNRNKELQRKCDAVLEEIRTKDANKQPKREKYISPQYISKSSLKKGEKR